MIIGIFQSSSKLLIAEKVMKIVIKVNFGKFIIDGEISEFNLIVIFYLKNQQFIGFGISIFDPSLL